VLLSVAGCEILTHSRPGQGAFVATQHRSLRRQPHPAHRSRLRRCDLSEAAQHDRTLKLLVSVGLTVLLLIERLGIESARREPDKAKH
jgi:hypothetical protein